MQFNTKNFIRSVTPPVIVHLAKKLSGKEPVEYSGNFATWKEAVAKTSGYDDSAIFEKVKKARLQVLSGEKKYERDSVTFDAVQYFWPLIAALFVSAAREHGRLSVADFGGSLGSTYFQNLSFLQQLKDVSWGVVEQKHFVTFGKERLAGGSLSFHESMEECVLKNRSNVALFSSVLQYLEKPYELLEETKKRSFSAIILDRTTILESDKDRITVQHVPKKIYDATFPAWFLSEKKILATLADRYECVASWASIGDPIHLENGHGRNKGYLFIRKPLA